MFELASASSSRLTKGCRHPEGMEANYQNLSLWDSRDIMTFIHLFDFMKLNRRVYLFYKEADPRDSVS